MLLFSAWCGCPQHEHPQRLRKQVVQYGLFWMGADDRMSEKNQTWAGHIYCVTLVLWFSWFAWTSSLSGSSIHNACRSQGSAICRHCVCSSQTRCSCKPREPQYQRHTIDMPSPSLIFFRHAIICAHPEQTVSYDLVSQTLWVFVLRMPMLGWKQQHLRPKIIF